jgi:hypothetical protein
MIRVAISPRLAAMILANGGFELSKANPRQNREQLRDTYRLSESIEDANPTQVQNTHKQTTQTNALTEVSRI